MGREPWAERRRADLGGSVANIQMRTLKTEDGKWFHVNGTCTMVSKVNTSGRWNNVGQGSRSKLGSVTFWEIGLARGLGTGPSFEPVGCRRTARAAHCGESGSAACLAVGRTGNGFFLWAIPGRRTANSRTVGQGNPTVLIKKQSIAMVPADANANQMPRHLISDAHEWINEIPTVPVYYPAKTTAVNKGNPGWQNHGENDPVELTLVRHSGTALFFVPRLASLGRSGRKNIVSGEFGPWGAQHLLKDNAVRIRTVKAWPNDPLDLRNLKLEVFRKGYDRDILALWQQAFIATLLFDPSMSALPINVKQNSPSVGLFTHQ
ncbi:hypothetical protein Tco_1227228 [Tanacetum coccineum]